MGRSATRDLLLGLVSQGITGLGCHSEERSDEESLWQFLPDPNLLNQQRQLPLRNVIQRPLIFLLKTFAKVFRGYEAGLAIAQVAARARPELHKSGMRQAHNRGAPVDQEFRIHRIAVTRGNPIPKVREPNLIILPRQWRHHAKRADEFAHRPFVGNRRLRGCCGHFCLVRFSFDAPRSQARNGSSFVWPLPPRLRMKR